MAEITDSDVASMVVLSGLNWDNDEIAAEVGVSESSVSKYLNQVESDSKADGADPYTVWGNTVAPGVLMNFSEELGVVLGDSLRGQ